jgi:hypothetical protein
MTLGASRFATGTVIAIDGGHTTGVTNPKYI